MAVAPDARQPVELDAAVASDADVARCILRAQEGDAGAWAEIVGRYGRRVFALAKSRCGSAELAEEITQSVFATVAMKLGQGKYAEQGRFEPWILRIAMNRLRDQARRAKRQARPTAPENFAGLVDPRGGPASRADGEREQLDSLRRAMDQLSEADREIVEMRHHGGLSFKAMAELLGEPVGTLLARHHRALRKLKSIMETRGAGPDAGKDG